MTSPHSCVIQVFRVSPSNERGEAMLSEARWCEAPLGTTWQSLARHGENTLSSTVA
jgi:hypothetical protein